MSDLCEFLGLYLQVKSRIILELGLLSEYSIIHSDFMNTIIWHSKSIYCISDVVHFKTIKLNSILYINYFYQYNNGIIALDRVKYVFVA